MTEISRSLGKNGEGKLPNSPEAGKVIRGHHLEVFTELVNKNLTPQGIVEYEFSMATGSNVVVADDVKERIKNGEIAREVEGSYKYDLLGDATPEEVKKFQEKRLELYKDFNTMGDDTPVRLVVGQKDDLCNQCAIGSHCSGDFEFDGDTDYVKAFTNVAARNNLEAQLVVRTEEVFVRGKDGPIEATVVETNAAVLRTVLSGDALMDEVRTVEMEYSQNERPNA